MLIGYRRAGNAFVIILTGCIGGTVSSGGFAPLMSLLLLSAFFPCVSSASFAIVDPGCAFVGM
jgi:hypothetical protein